MSSKHPSLGLEEKHNLWVVLAAVLLFAPLFRAGNRPLPLMVLELAALVLFALWWTQRKKQRQISIAETAMVGGILSIPLLQLIPLSPEFWAEAIPGRAFYAQGLRQALGEQFFSEHWRPLALIPSYGEAAWLALLPPVAVFLAARSLSAHQLQKLIYLFLGIATFQAVLGLIQYGAGPKSVFLLGNEHYSHSAAGTYINRNHLAGLLEMALPVVLALLIAAIGQPSRLSYSRGGWRQRFLTWSNRRGNRSMLYAAMALVILLGIVFTRSRAGIMLAMVGLFLSFLAFAGKVGSRKTYGTVGVLTFAGAMLALEIGLAPVLSRFAAMNESLQDGRWAIFSGTLQAIGEFFPFGSGSGSYAEVFPRFQADDFLIGAFIHRAHNDYLEWLLVGGLPVAILIIVGLLLYFRQWFKVWRGKQDSSFSFIQIGAGIGLFLLLLHTLVDFNLHIPANAIFFAFLLGIFFHPPKERRRRRQKDQVSPVAEPKPARPREIPPENRINPFKF
ncbi:O-antigen ligase family protein [Nitrosococcus wardiae]|uniref:O-antigen ligase domain-containing protein n=1 Tax=Nitrosococcus wardiae TaxID=1814290 RepID=A0A4P7C2Q6_9GAMM|nr:O-antigen ligase family protein [Nitrosococcus wardiae]QBQ55977.1 O-antigen ligase domain-containing protein [Nitrosococcus wardiae]